MTVAAMALVLCIDLVKTPLFDKCVLFTKTNCMAGMDYESCAKSVVSFRKDVLK